MLVARNYLVLGDLTGLAANRFLGWVPKPLGNTGTIRSSRRVGSCSFGTC